jgi:hypothetical protein
MNLIAIFLALHLAYGIYDLIAFIDGFALALAGQPPTQEVMPLPKGYSSLLSLDRRLGRLNAWRANP